LKNTATKNRIKKTNYLKHIKA